MRDRMNKAIAIIRAAQDAEKQELVNAYDEQIALMSDEALAITNLIEQAALDKYQREKLISAAETIEQLIDNKKRDRARDLQRINDDTFAQVNAVKQMFTPGYSFDKPHPLVQVLLAELTDKE
jgi:ribosomal protein S15P/S13E